MNAADRVTGNPVGLEQDVRLADGGFSGAAHVAWSTGGTFAYVSTAAADSLHRSLVWFDRSGRMEPIADLPARRYQGASAQMRVSPDGGRVALTILADSSSSTTETVRGQDIWIWAIAQGTLSRLTFTARSASPVWSPDGKRVCNASDQELVCQSADGTGQRQPMFDVAGPFRFSEIGPMTPDGRTMLLGVRETNRSDTDIALASMGTRFDTRSLVHSPADELSPAISPDGRWIAYVSSDGTSEVYVRPFPDVDSGRRQISSGGGLDPQWSPKGGELFYLDASGSAGAAPVKGLMAVEYRAAQGFTFRKPTTLFKFPSTAFRGFAVGHDGRFLLNVPAAFAAETAARDQIVIAQNWFDTLKRRVAK